MFVFRPMARAVCRTSLSSSRHVDVVQFPHTSKHRFRPDPTTQRSPTAKTIMFYLPTFRIQHSAEKISEIYLDTVTDDSDLLDHPVTSSIPPDAYLNALVVLLQLKRPKPQLNLLRVPVSQIAVRCGPPTCCLCLTLMFNAGSWCCVCDCDCCSLNHSATSASGLAVKAPA